MSNVTFNPNVAINPNLQTDQIDETTNKHGTGVIDETSKTPPPPSDPSYSAVLNSLSKFIPALTGQILEVILLQVTVKMKEMEEANQKEKIKIDQEAKRTSIGEKQAKIEEAEKKIQEAKDKQESASIWDKIKLGFQALAAVLSIIAGVALLLTGVGGPAGGCLIAVGIIGLVMCADSLTKMLSENGMGMMGNLAKALGASDEVAGWLDFSFAAVLAVASIVLSIVAMRPDQMITGVANLAQSAVAIATGVIAIGTGIGDITTGVMRYDASKLESEGTKLQGEAKEMEAWLKQLDDFIDQALSRLMGSSDRFNQMLDDLMAAIQDSAKTVAKAKFTG